MKINVVSVGHGVIWVQTSIRDIISYFTVSGYQESDFKDKIANTTCKKIYKVYTFPEFIVNQ